MLKKPSRVDRPVPLLHDMACEAVHSLEMEIKIRSNDLGGPDQTERESRNKIVQLLRGVEHHLGRIVQVYEQSRANAAMIEEKHQVHQSFTINFKLKLEVTFYK